MEGGNIADYGNLSLYTYTLVPIAPNTTTPVQDATNKYLFKELGKGAYQLTVSDGKCETTAIYNIWEPGVISMTEPVYDACSNMLK